MIWHFYKLEPRESSGPNTNNCGSKKARVLNFFLKYMNQETFKLSKFSMFLATSHGFYSRESGKELTFNACQYLSLDFHLCYLI